MIVYIALAGILFGELVILGMLRRMEQRNIRTLAGIQTRLTAEKKRDYRKKK